jgi:hypothetical protein
MYRSRHLERLAAWNGRAAVHHAESLVTQPKSRIDSVRRPEIGREKQHIPGIAQGLTPSLFREPVILRCCVLRRRFVSLIGF